MQIKFDKIPKGINSKALHLDDFIFVPSTEVKKMSIFKRIYYSFRALIGKPAIKIEFCEKENEDYNRYKFMRDWSQGLESNGSV